MDHATIDNKWIKQLLFTLQTRFFGYEGSLNEVYL